MEIKFNIYSYITYKPGHYGASLRETYRLQTRLTLHTMSTVCISESCQRS